MKVGIVTFHFVNNFGGALQAYALQNCVSRECNVETVIVDYRNPFIRFTDTIRLFPITTNPKEFMSGLRTINKRLQRWKKFKFFWKDYYHLTKPYVTAGGIKQNSPGCDAYICGSDQIWNPIITAGIDGTYFLDFEPGKKKVSYAPSFGTSKINEKQEKKIQKYLMSFQALSVREQEGIHRLQKMTGKEAERLIDPAFLMTKEEWSRVAVSPKNKGKYILLYIMQRDEGVYQYARRLKEQLGLPLVEISRYGLKYDFVDECVMDIGPAEFVGWFEQAEYVCTNSYHGLIFSVIFGKQLCLIPCLRFGTRINNLLGLLQAKLREDFVVEFPKEAVLQEIILKEREKSFQYLKNNISEKE